MSFKSFASNANIDLPYLLLEKTKRDKKEIDRWQGATTTMDSNKEQTWMGHRVMGRWSNVGIAGLGTIYFF